MLCYNHRREPSKRLAEDRSEYEEVLPTSPP